MTTSILEPPSRKKLWMAALKPPMYSVAVIPVWVSTAVAMAADRAIDLKICLTFLISSVLILAWVNLSNDVFDAQTGIDINKASSIVNLTGNRSLIFWLGNLCLVGGLLASAAISWWQKDITVSAIAISGCILAYSYQGPPFRLGYQGLGEIICLIAYGPLLGSAVYYSQTQAWSGQNLAASLIVGIATSLILFCSHFHQLEDDRQAGKKSPIVRLGTQKAANLLPWYGMSIYGLTIIFILCGIFPWTTIAIFAAAPLAIALFQHAKKYHDLPEKVSNLKFIAVAWHFLSGIFLGCGFWLSNL
ncbi:2-carboxy-1,4-naphthoquinone phytyltransferase [Merismopedia glauca]|uniref:2-carboxy-1,4-naphthoquinone phytyltransferase n=1 Tax=Merismopedia glauca CCAP 1448/3 TaxID=1296344 RepID=A0A2T1BZK4_9CYAN|nr:2-carboxy-1,4-naphthoquinone phytyltransferase [Merismopedia glauca]PSB01456.1 2-carboxy-1,4-naphthoquinone phytyltransferase [Merismopedia glauca CCAP 1448/3]